MSLTLAHAEMPAEGCGPMVRGAFESHVVAGQS